MKRSIAVLVLLLFLMSRGSYARKTELYNSKYFVFQSNMPLNAHLFLYSKAVICKYAQVGNDSLGYYALKEYWKDLSLTERVTMNKIVGFYRDSLLSKDLLFDSLMRNFEDYLSADALSKLRPKTGWQAPAAELLKSFQPIFTRFYWQAIDSTNKAWINAHKAEITSLEITLVPELERIYKTKLPEEKIRVDLCCYATWAGAYSYSEGYNHIFFSTYHKNNQGELAAEVIFHETSHFLVDKLSEAIASAARRKNVKKDLALWHNVIFYTTGFVMEKHYKLKWQKYQPYYIQMKFQEKFPEFKNSMDACRLYWDPYLNGQAAFEDAVTNLVTHVIDKQQ